MCFKQNTNKWGGGLARFAIANRAVRLHTIRHREFILKQR